jgi:transposase-like protein
MPDASTEANITPEIRAPEPRIPAAPHRRIQEMPAETELPPPDTKRWVARRKAAVVTAVQSRKITVDEACRRYQLSEGELLAWQRAFDTYGERGLRATRLQQYRGASTADPTKFRL